MQTIQLDLTLGEINQILAALGERPYAQVYQLIEKIKGQAERQVNVNPPVDSAPAPHKEER